MSRLLTEGSVSRIVLGDLVEYPIIQLLGSRRITGAADERYRLLVSDGSHLNSVVMLSTQLNDMLTSGELSNYSVVRVNNLVTNIINLRGGRKICVTIILDLTVLAKGTEVGTEIGNPTFFTQHEVDLRPMAPLAPPPRATVPRAVALRAAALRAVIPHAAMWYGVIRTAAAFPTARMCELLQRIATSPPEPLRTDLMSALVLPPTAMRAALVRVAARLEPAWRTVARRSVTSSETARRAVLMHSETLRSAALYARLRSAAQFPPAQMREVLLRAAERLSPAPMRTELLHAASLPPEAMRAAVRRATTLLAPSWRVMIPRGGAPGPAQLRMLVVRAEKQRNAALRLVFHTVATSPPAQMRERLLRAAARLPASMSGELLRMAELPPVAMRAAVMRAAWLRAPARRVPAPRPAAPPA